MIMDIAVYTLTSPLHDENAVNAVSKDFIAGIEKALGTSLDFKGADFTEYGTHDLDIIYVRTGGTEGLFKEVFPGLGGNILLMTSGKSNSLAASMEIMSYLNRQGRKGEIIHGSVEYIAERLRILAQVSAARKSLKDKNLGIIGKPSDWLISSEADNDEVARRLGLNLVDIDIEELITEIRATDASEAEISEDLKDALAKAPAAVRKYTAGALAVYAALKKITARHSLSGLTLRCFDLLSAVGNTGCLALALLNAEGIPAGCEGDVPAVLTMAVGQALIGQCGFQANPSRIDPQTGEFLFAHCTVPFNMIGNYSFNTHFESGIGIAVHGELPEGDVTVAKVSGDLSRTFCRKGRLSGNRYEDNLCRTQITVHLDDCAEYFLTNPIGNHHIIFTGDHQALFDAFFRQA